MHLVNANYSITLKWHEKYCESLLCINQILSTIRNIWYYNYVKYVYKRCEQVLMLVFQMLTVLNKMFSAYQTVSHRQGKKRTIN